jgi:hypothetical protein
MKFVRSVSGTWHKWIEDIDGLARTECNRLVKPKKYVEAEHTSGQIVRRPVVFGSGAMCCGGCRWYL